MGVEVVARELLCVGHLAHSRAARVVRADVLGTGGRDEVGKRLCAPERLGEQVRAVEQIAVTDTPADKLNGDLFIVAPARRSGMSSRSRSLPEAMTASVRLAGGLAATVFAEGAKAPTSKKAAMRLAMPTAILTNREYFSCLVVVHEPLLSLVQCRMFVS